MSKSYDSYVPLDRQGQDYAYIIHQLQKQVESLLSRVSELEKYKAETDEDWDNATMMIRWKRSKRALASYRKERGLGYYKSGGLIYYTKADREAFKKFNPVLKIND